MARPLRIEFPGAVYHLTARGDGREDIYLDEKDREQFLGLLGAVCERFNWVGYAYCLMGNHYHLVMETPDGNLSRGMRQLNGVYTQRFNARHGRVGHVFQGRYKAILVERDSYLLELCRYVVLNPVRAGMVRHAGQWRWSSYRDTTGQRAAPSWLAVSSVLGQFGRGRASAIARYKAFVRQGTGQANLWEQSLRQPIYLGDEAFVTRMQAKLAESDLAEVPRAQHRRPALPLAEYAKRHPERRAAMAAAYRSGDYTLKAIAEHFGVHYSTVSRALRVEWGHPPEPGG